MLYTHLANKCFRTRDISFGKRFKERIGLLPLEKDPENSPWRRLRTIPGFVHEDIVKAEQRSALKKLRELFPARESDNLTTSVLHVSDRRSSSPGASAEAFFLFLRRLLRSVRAVVSARPSNH